MHIYIDTVVHEHQRYPTVGDWWSPRREEDEEFVLYVHVSRMRESQDYEFLVALHELIEAYLCHKRGISEEEVTQFDKIFEQSRPEGDTSEPGDSPLAPYHKEHAFATSIELALAQELGVEWEKYEKVVNSL